jgi:hypothetical protein
VRGRRSKERGRRSKERELWEDMERAVGEEKW